ncbi:MAG: hypothetical protein COV33_02565 [Candidatus Zambryskibacteria bacterium CG10_big_fil_rev_8_21_14_0_10_34_34]|uniref:Uncharacterized protein n=1 Tax=Candidatus Zambryskibacteria bacterium CG10_big_fil_rev_8_21_14_0_10_34_34 TaxID=1975114 RepID=A0A2H0R1M2_9BACT|nr:MAG: hypothetical protein COV33_02565 [Candidatus Zambryskibacteria bacterium CG10_big_fil_rev_8_21_14_0_10_34_34]
MAKKKNNNLWYIIGGVVIVVLVLWIILANTGGEKVVCNSPYIQVGQSCCLDQNYNQICDNEEVKESPYKNYEVKLYLDRGQDNINNYLSNPEQIPSFGKMSSVYLYGNTTENGVEYFYGPYTMYLYSDYTEERISCDIEEYYDNKLNLKFNIVLSYGPSFTNIGYEQINTPSRVRYDLDCKGMESGIEYTDTYNFNLIK